MKKKIFWQMATVFAITMFITSCKKTTTDVVAEKADEYRLQEKDETG